MQTMVTVLIGSLWCHHQNSITIPVSCENKDTVKWGPRVPILLGEWGPGGPISLGMWESLGKNVDPPLTHMADCFPKSMRTISLSQEYRNPLYG